MRTVQSLELFRKKVRSQHHVHVHTVLYVRVERGGVRRKLTWFNCIGWYPPLPILPHYRDVKVQYRRTGLSPGKKGIIQNTPPGRSDPPLPPSQFEIPYYLECWMSITAPQLIIRHMIKPVSLFVISISLEFHPIRFLLYPPRLAT
jgi:hypothetical protein